jgi:hypothetical protein
MKIDLRERLFSTLNHNKKDKLAWYGDLSYWHFAHQVSGDIKERFKNYEGLIELNKEFGAGFYKGFKPVRATLKSSNLGIMDRERHSIKRKDKNIKLSKN